MMSRFSRLEFEKPEAPAQEEPKNQGEAIRDRFYFQKKADENWLSGLFEDALRNYSRSLEDSSAFYEGWFGQVRMLIELEEYPEAITWADKSLELFPEHHELLAGKAVATLRRGDLEEAHRLSDAAIAKGDATHYVLISRAEILQAEGSRAAETCVRNAVSISGQDLATASLDGGRVLLRGENFGAALPLLSDAVKLLPNSALAWLELGRCQSSLGFSEAKASITHCLSLRPNWTEAEAALQAPGKRGIFSWLRRKR